MIVKIKEVTFFKAIIRSMSQVEYITFKIANQKLIMSSALIDIYYTEIDSTLLEFSDYEEKDFTVNANLLKKVLKSFKTQLMLRMNDTLELCFESSKKSYDIAIPFIKTIKNELNEMKEIDTIFVAPPSDLNFLQNFKIATYEFRDKLMVKEDIDGGIEEMEFSIDILKSNRMPFKCNNSWLGGTKTLRSYVENAVFMINLFMCQVTFNFKNQKDSKFTIQVPKLYTHK